MKGCRARVMLFWVARLLLSAVFIYAAVAKIKSPHDFADAIAAYQILPPSIINLVAVSLPLFELTCGLMVLSGFYIRLGALGILIMLVTFITAVATAQFRGLSIDCGCFGRHAGFDSAPAFIFVRDVFLLVLAAMAYSRSSA